VEPDWDLFGTPTEDREFSKAAHVPIYFSAGQENESNLSHYNGLFGFPLLLPFPAVINIPMRFPQTSEKLKIADNVLDGMRSSKLIHMANRVIARVLRPYADVGLFRDIGDENVLGNSLAMSSELSLNTKSNTYRQNYSMNNDLYDNSSSELIHNAELAEQVVENPSTSSQMFETEQIKNRMFHNEYPEHDSTSFRPPPREPVPYLYRLRFIQKRSDRTTYYSSADNFYQNPGFASTAGVLDDDVKVRVESLPAEKSEMKPMDEDTVSAEDVPVTFISKADDQDSVDPDKVQELREDESVDPFITPFHFKDRKIVFLADFSVPVVGHLFKSNGFHVKFCFYFVIM
jgi:hypothetical protein